MRSYSLFFFFKKKMSSPLYIIISSHVSFIFEVIILNSSYFESCSQFTRPTFQSFICQSRMRLKSMASYTLVDKYLQRGEVQFWGRQTRVVNAILSSLISAISDRLIKYCVDCRLHWIIFGGILDKKIKVYGDIHNILSHQMCIN